MLGKGVQKTEEPKKPLQTEPESLQKFWFGFGFIIYKNKNFGSVFGGKFECTELTEPNKNILLYIIILYFILNI